MSDDNSITRDQLQTVRVESTLRRRAFRSVIALICVFLVVIPPGIAYAWSALIYAQGNSFQGGGIFHTQGYAPRNYDIAWHQPGYKWVVYYEDTSGDTHPPGGFYSTDNPTRIDTNVSYDSAWCQNVNDNSGVTWTCQTTTP